MSKAHQSAPHPALPVTEALERLREELATVRGLEATLRVVGHWLPRVLSVCDRASLAFLDPGGDYLRFYRLYPPMPSLPDAPRRVRAADTVVGRVAREGSPHVVHDLRANKNITFGHAAHDGIRSTVSVPVHVAGRLVGSLNTGSQRVGRASGDEVLTQLTVLAEIVGPAVYAAEDSPPGSDLEWAAKEGLFGASPAFSELVGQARRVARSEATVLLMGETGVGKTALARAIHRWSPRRTGPFVTVHLADLPQSLVESELFGHERGAFTGAAGSRAGRFEAAHRGTILLDEIGEAPLSVQAKLLRVLQDRTFERLGGNVTVPADVRVIAATNRDLDAAVAAGEFRKDLLYRLNTLPIHVPPLRERPEDVRPLVTAVLERLAARDNRPYRLSDGAWARLEAHGWPGNIRELENALVRATVHEPSAGLTLDTLPSGLGTRPAPVTATDWPTRDEHERRYLRRVMAHTEGRVEGPQGAAEILGMRPSTLRSRLKRLGVAVHSFRREGERS